MTVGELFVNIGIKGAEKVVQSVGEVSKGITDLASNSLAAKAAIVAIFYGAERFMSGAAQVGTALHNYEILTGRSTDKLQEWQEAARRSGESAEQMAGDMLAAQKSMVDMRLGIGGPPGGLAFISQYVKGLDGKRGFDETRLDDPAYIMQMLRQFAQNKGLPEGVKTSFLNKMGISDATIVTLKNYTGELDKIDRFYISSKGEVDQLNRINIAWSTLGKNLEMYQRHFVAKNGMFVVSNISHAVNELLKLSSAFLKLTNQVPALKYISIALAAIAGFSFAPLTASVIALTAVLADLDKGKKGVIGKALDWRDGLDKKAFGFLKDQGLDLSKVFSNFDLSKMFSSSVLPALQGAGAPGAGKDVNVNQTINVYGAEAKDKKAIGDLHKQAIRQAGTQLQGLGH